MRRLVLCLLLLVSAGCHAQTLQAVFLSDLHFDPLRDPAKANRLAAAAASDWAAILGEPDTPTQAADFAAVQAKCGTRSGLDSDFPLLSAALHAARAQASGARFVTVSGDLVVHQFECRWKAATGRDKGYAGFHEKTAVFVMHQVEAAFPGLPVYIAPGNNDSSCGDYRMDLDDRYFAATAGAVLDGLTGASPRDLAQARTGYLKAGFFSVPLAGLPRTRLLSIDDIYLSRKYKTCAGSPDTTGASTVLKWLANQFDQARKHGETVWILGHIPPGIDVYSTVTRARDVCAGEAPETFLADDALPNLLADNASLIRLALFGHTHSDEIRLLGQVPAKFIGSVTPVNGNLPSFTIAQVDRKTSRLADYAVYTASSATGANPWALEYDYRKTFGTGPTAADAFTPAALDRQIAGFRKDPAADTPTSRSYQQSFFPGSPSPLGLVWPQAVCALDNYTAAAYRACVCKP